MRWLRRALEPAGPAQKIPLDGIGRHEDVGWFRMKMVFGGAQKAKAFFRDFQVARAVIVSLGLVVVSLTFMPLTFVPLTFVFVAVTVVVFGSCAHTVCCVLRKAYQNNPRKPLLNFEFWEAVGLAYSDLLPANHN